MNTARKVLCSLTVAATAASASAATIVVKDEFGATVRNATVSVTMMGNLTPMALAPTPVQATDTVAGYVVSNSLTGMSVLEFNHPAYGTLRAKADLSLPTIELVLGNNGGGFNLHQPGQGGDSASGPTQRLGGDTCGTATLIPWASITAGGGYTDTGTTGVNNNSPNCSADGSDVFYTFTPTADACVAITTCWNGSTTDTVLQLKTAANCAAGPAIDCNDDNCTIPPGGSGLNSTLAPQNVTAGQQYNIQIDNWNSNASAPYQLHVALSTQCPVALAPCPAGAVVEGEPNCGLSLPACTPNDTVNGGCNATPARFSNMACGDTFCGTYGNCGATRDTDWIQQVQTSLTVNSFCCVGEAALSLYGLVAMNGGVNTGACPGAAFASFANNVPNNTTACVSQLAYPGTWTWFAATANFAGTPCGADYQCTLDCVCPAGCGGTPPPSGGTNFDGAGRDR